MSEAFKKQVMHDGKSNFRNGQFVPNGSSLSHLQTNVGSLLFWHKNRTTYMCLLISNIRKKKTQNEKGIPWRDTKKKGWWRSSLEDEFHQKKNGLLLKKLFRASKLHTIMWKFDGKISWNQLILCWIIIGSCFARCLEMEFYSLEKFRETNIQRKMADEEIFRNLTHDGVEKWEILSHRHFFSWNQLFRNFFSKNVAFTKFLSKSREDFSNIHTLYHGN